MIIPAYDVYGDKGLHEEHDLFQHFTDEAILRIIRQNWSWPLETSGSEKIVFIPEPAIAWIKLNRIDLYAKLVALGKNDKHRRYPDGSVEWRVIRHDSTKYNELKVTWSTQNMTYEEAVAVAAIEARRYGAAEKSIHDYIYNCDEPGLRLHDGKLAIWVKHKDEQYEAE